MAYVHGFKIFPYQILLIKKNVSFHSEEAWQTTVNQVIKVNIRMQLEESIIPDIPAKGK